ncbi:MAG: hypothetical protein NTY55_00845 [Flavobacteriia bacterium]|nr:hypothetical protein [Flavobacteriia bacterium]
MLFIKILISLTIFVISYRILVKINPKYAINLKRVICPVCKKKQPIVRKPKNERQALWGGWTCSNCQTELDKFGNIIKE